MRKTAIAAVFVLASAFVAAQDIALPGPKTRAGVDVIDAMNARTGSRSFVKRDVPLADLATILWAGGGVRRGVDAVSAASRALRTIPYSGNLPYLHIYYLSGRGAFLYDPEENLLRQVAANDVRASVSGRLIPTSAFMTLFTADLASAPPYVKASPIAAAMQHAAAAAAGQNMAVAAATLGLDSITMYGINAAQAIEALRLSEEEPPLSIMQFGYRQ